MRNLLFVFALGCTSSPLAESAPQIEVTSNPGSVPDHPLFAVTLTTWNHLAALSDAASSGQLEVRLQGVPLVLDPSATGTFDNGDRFTATYVRPGTLPLAELPISTITVTDQQSTWTAQI